MNDFIFPRTEMKRIFPFLRKDWSPAGWSNKLTKLLSSVEMNWRNCRWRIPLYQSTEFVSSIPWYQALYEIKEKSVRKKEFWENDYVPFWVGWPPVFHILWVITSIIIFKQGSFSTEIKGNNLHILQHYLLDFVSMKDYPLGCSFTWYGGVHYLKCLNCFCCIVFT